MVDSVTQRGRRWEGGRVGDAGQKDRANPAGKLKQRSKQGVQTDKENFPLPANSVPS